MNNKLKYIALIAVSTLAFFMGGCVRQVEPKELVTAEANETMFVIPLQGENVNNQVKFNSIEYFNAHKVAVKQILIPHYWLNTGRFQWLNIGRWVPSVQVIKVNRSPVTVEYVVNNKTNTRNNRDAIWVESSDSVGFSTGFSVSAFIAEADTSTFLYRYPATGLRDVLNTEIRARIQQDAAEFAAKYNLDSLRSKKNEMIEFIRNDVIPFYRDRGITITTIGMFGGMTYENPEIQQAIDNVFIAQQEKKKAAALLAAQDDINKKSESATQQEKRNVLLLAQGQASAITVRAAADSDAIRQVAKATQDAEKNPLFLEIRKLEVEKARIDKWNGTVPASLIESGDNSGLNLLLPSPSLK